MDPIRLRGHNLLCLLGYRGRGYDERFVAAMTAVHRQVTAHPDTPVLVLDAPDTLCGACPHRDLGGCRLGGSPHEAHMRAQDRDVLRRLGMVAGEVYAWRDVLGRVARAVRGADLPGICTTCPWLELGWCAEGVERVAQGLVPQPPGPAP